METATPKTLLEAVRYYSDLGVCHTYMVNIKWPDGKITCPNCGGNAIGKIKSRRLFQCKDKSCRKQFSAKVGTIFEDSPLGLDKWFVAVWFIANAKNGISSWELHRALGVTQKTAWHMLHRIRLAMQTKSFGKMDGEIESDETFVGGKARFMHAAKRAERIQGRGMVGKTIVHGFLQRTTDDKPSQVRAKVVPDQKRGTLQGIIRERETSYLEFIVALFGASFLETDTRLPPDTILGAWHISGTHARRSRRLTARKTQPRIWQGT